jgi:copper chaperone CopZ
MTYLDVAYRYRDVPTEKEMRAIGSIREVYGVLQVQFDEKERTVKVRFDASRLNEEEIAGLLRQAGLALQERLILT